MKVLLRQDVPNVGVIGDVVEVGEGFARNYLLPQRVAVQPTAGNLKRVEAEKVARELAAKQQLEVLKAVAAKLAGLSITIKAKANELGHLFGSVTEQHIADALAAEGYKVNLTQVALAAPDPDARQVPRPDQTGRGHRGRDRRLGRAGIGSHLTPGEYTGGGEIGHAGITGRPAVFIVALPVYPRWRATVCAGVSDVISGLGGPMDAQTKPCT